MLDDFGAIAIIGAAAIAAVMVGGFCAGVRPPNRWVSTLGIHPGTRRCFTWALTAGGLLVAPCMFASDDAPASRVAAALAVLGLWLVGWCDMRSKRTWHVVGATTFFAAVTAFVGMHWMRAPGPPWLDSFTALTLAGGVLLLGTATIGFHSTCGFPGPTKFLRSYVRFMTSNRRRPWLQVIRTIEWGAVALLVAWLICLASA